MSCVPFLSPHCGYALPANASRCRQCGASAEYGWDSVDGYVDDFEADSLEDDFDYDEFVAREFPERRGSFEDWPRPFDGVKVGCFGTVGVVDSDICVVVGGPGE